MGAPQLKGVGAVLGLGINGGSRVRAPLTLVRPVGTCWEERRYWGGGSAEPPWPDMGAPEGGWGCTPERDLPGAPRGDSPAGRAGARPPSSSSTLSMAGGKGGRVPPARP